jgi:YgiT-type zinc finger domain-containing protein
VRTERLFYRHNLDQLAVHARNWHERAEFWFRRRLIFDNAGRPRRCTNNQFKERMMKCGVCGSNRIVQDTRDLPYVFKRQETVIANVAGGYCAACGEVILNTEEAARVSAMMLEFNQQVTKSINKKSPGTGRGF